MAQDVAKPPTHLFQKGNQLAKGHGQGRPPHPNFLTQALISQLNEVDKDTDKRKLHLLAERLLVLALGGVIEVHRRKPEGGRYIDYINVSPDLEAIKEVFNRVQGKAVTQVGFDAGSGKVTIIFDKEDEAA